MKPLLSIALVNMAVLGGAWMFSSTARPIHSRTKLVQTLLQLRQDVAGRDEAEITRTTADLKRVDDRLELRPELYQTLDRLAGSSGAGPRTELKKFDAVIVGEIARLNELTAGEIRETQRRNRLLGQGLAGLALFNAAAFGLFAWLGRRRESEFAAVEARLSAAESELRDAMLSQRDTALEVLQRNREYRKLAKELVLERAESNLDGMTKAYTKKVGMQKLFQVIDQNIGRDPVVVAMADLDFFKRVNDTYGHPAGDTVIKTFADLILENIRQNEDFLIRYGGEEFIIVFSGQDAETAQSVLERLQTEVQKTRIFVRDLSAKEQLVKSTIREGSSITFSCGFAEISESALFDAAIEVFRNRNQRELGDDEEEIEHISLLVEDIKALADKRLYHAKQSGRNRIAGPENHKMQEIKFRYQNNRDLEAMNL